MLVPLAVVAAFTMPLQMPDPRGGTSPSPPLPACSDGVTHVDPHTSKFVTPPAIEIHTVRTIRGASVLFVEWGG